MVGEFSVVILLWYNIFVYIFKIFMLLTSWGKYQFREMFPSLASCGLMFIAFLMGTMAASVPYANAQAGANLAHLSSATTNSEAVIHGQTANKAIDGVIDGFPMDSTKEWVTEDPIHLGAWLKLTWNSPVTIDLVVLFDRKSASGGMNEHITAGTLTFSDGSTVSVGPLNDDGSATNISFSSRTVTSLTFTITGMGVNSHDVGLMEIEVFGAGGGCSAGSPCIINSCPGTYNAACVCQDVANDGCPSVQCTGCSSWSNAACGDGCATGQRKQVCTAPAACVAQARCTNDASCVSTQCDVQAVAQEAHRFRATSSDPDQDEIYYVFDWGDNQTSRLPTSGLVGSATAQEAVHIWGTNGIYTVGVRAYDSQNTVSPLSNTLQICVGSQGGNGGGRLTPDLNGDGVVDIVDLALILQRWGTNDPIADINKDGIVDILDYTTWLAYWLAGQ